MSSDSVRIGIVTGENTPELPADGQLLQSVLQDRGYSAEPVVWSDSHEWESFDSMVVRYCWQYYEQPAAFEEWLNTITEAGVRVLNPASVIRWNVHKFYLRDLQEAGVSVPSTVWVTQDSDRNLNEILSHRSWDDAVIKPAIGTSSDGVWRLSTPVTDDEEERFQSAVADGDMLVQEFDTGIRHGELSLVFFEGYYSHAFRGVPAPDDFRAHPHYDGKLESAAPDDAVVSQARTIVEAAANECGVDPDELAYARVDGIDRDGAFTLLELELVEPFLLLEEDERRAERFADAIVRQVGKP